MSWIDLQLSYVCFLQLPHWLIWPIACLQETARSGMAGGAAIRIQGTLTVGVYLCPGSCACVHLLAKPNACHLPRCRATHSPYPYNHIHTGTVATSVLCLDLWVHNSPGHPHHWSHSSTWFVVYWGRTCLSFSDPCAEMLSDSHILIAFFSEAL